MMHFSSKHRFKSEIAIQLLGNGNTENATVLLTE